MNTRWIINKEVDKQNVEDLSNVLGIDRNLATLLVQRGIRNYDEAKDFFRPSLTHLHDPFLMKDMDKAVERIKKAWENGEKILVYGDYDVDGTTAVALIYTYLKNFISKKKISFYIPDRYDEGYGISYKGIDTSKVKVLFDETAKNMKNFAIGANQKDKHIVGANLEDNIEFVDISLVKEGEFCPKCKKPLKVTRGIEVGNIFQLGTKYSAPMNACYTDENGKLNPYIMGCYGIGVSRTMAAAIEKYHDDFGIVWPIEIAPYHVDVVPVDVNNEEQLKIATEIYEKLSALGIEAILDDRLDRAGVKFKDADLIGFPIRITVGKTITEGLVEFKTRKDGNMIKISPDEAIKECQKIILN